jgi:hypothetical protein
VRKMGGVVEYHSRYLNHHCHKYSSLVSRAYERPAGAAIAICHRNTISDNTSTTQIPSKHKDSTRQQTGMLRIVTTTMTKMWVKTILP